MRRHLRALVCILTAAASLAADAATSYRFSAVTEGSHPARSSGIVTVDGKRWRISYDKVADEVTVLTAAIGRDGETAVALNDENQTYYALPERSLRIDPGLFAYGSEVKISKLKLSRETVPPSAARIIFSYRFDSRTAGEPLHGNVRGEIRIRTRHDFTPASLPWNPVELHTGIEPFDEALRNELAKIEGTPIECVLEVSRQLEGGPALKQTVTRSIEPLAPVNPDEREFRIPAGYRNQAPMVGFAN